MRPQVAKPCQSGRQAGRCQTPPVSEVDLPTETDVGWLSPETLELVRANVPLVYVDAVPVRGRAASRKEFTERAAVRRLHRARVEQAPFG